MRASRHRRWTLGQFADAEIGHVRDGFGAVVVAEFGSGFLAGVHARDAGPAGVMGRPLGDVVDLSGDDDPAVVPCVVPGDLLPRDPAVALGRNCRRPERAGDPGGAGLGGPAEVPRSQSLGWQRGADLAGVVGVDPGIVLAAALVVGEGGADPLVERLEQRLLLFGVPGPQVVERELGAELEAGGAIVAHALVMQ